MIAGRTLAVVVGGLPATSLVKLDFITRPRTMKKMDVLASIVVLNLVDGKRQTTLCMYSYCLPQS